MGFFVDLGHEPVIVPVPLSAMCRSVVRPPILGERGVLMKKETLRSLKELAYFSSLGLQVALSIVIGLGLGIFLDRRYDTNPWLTLIGLGLGIAAGYRNIALALRKIQKQQ